MKHLSHIIIIIVILLLCFFSVKHIYEHFTDTQPQYQYQYNILSPVMTSPLDGKIIKTPVYVNATRIADIGETAHTTSSPNEPKDKQFDPTNITVPVAKELCNQNDECAFFTCAPVSSSTKSLNCLKTNNCEQQNKCAMPVWYSENDSVFPMEFTKTTEQYIKNANAPSVSVKNTTVFQNELNRWYNKPFTSILGSGLGKYDYSSPLLSENNVKNRLCDTTNTNDINCFLQGSQKEQAQNYVINKKLSTDPIQINDENKYVYYKDQNYNIHLKNTDTCCFPSVQEVQRKIRIDNKCDETQNTSSPELCAPTPQYSVIRDKSIFGNGLECPDGFVKRNDLGLCVPEEEKCSQLYVNDSVCSKGGKYTEDYKKECSNILCQKKNAKCAISEFPSQVHNCLPGKTPYYTFLGKYNDIVDVSEKIKTLQNLQKNNTYQMIDPHYPDYITSNQTQTILGNIDDITLENIANKTIVVNGYTYTVSNITLEMNYIEMKSKWGELKWYMLNALPKKKV